MTDRNALFGWTCGTLDMALMVIKEILTLCVLMGAIPVSCDIFHMLLISSHSISHCFGTCPHGAKTVWADGWFGAWMLRKGTGSTWLFKKSHIGVWNSHQSLGYKSLKRCLFVCMSQELG